MISKESGCMAELAIARSPLGHLAALAPSTALTLHERPFHGMVALRVDPRDDAARAAVETALRAALPQTNRTIACADSGVALWLGPDEFLIVTEPGEEAPLATTLSAALRGLRGAVVDISDSRTIVALSGKRARDLLAKGSGLDLHPRSFAPGQCAQSFLAKVKIALHQLDDTPSYHIIVERSVAEYLFLWLADAAREFAVDSP
jgi:sarcosine oxidase, subunit gamma